VSVAAGRRFWLSRVVRGLLRTWRRCRLLVSPPACTFVYHSGYEQRFPSVPIDPMRGEKILGFLKAEGLLRRSLLLEARQGSLQEILRIHSPDYLRDLESTEALTRIFGAPVSPGEVEPTLELQRLMTGGTLRACRTALRTGGVAVNLGGGFHHALADEGMAFCTFNDIAVAVADLRARGYSRPILVVDLDVHDGNGTRGIFAQDPTVHTYSIHGESWGPGGAIADTTIALGHGVEDEEYLHALRTTLPELAEAFSPGLVLYVAGADPAADDRLGDWKITPEGMLARDRLVAELFRRRQPVPLVVLLAGGYGNEAWRYPARFLAWLLAGNVIEPPQDDELSLERFRSIGRSLTPAELSLDQDGLPFTLEPADLVGVDPGLPPQSRFLGFFSRHGTELMLERFGILPRLRELGFEELRIDIDLGGATGHTLRVVTETTPELLLVELRACRKPSSLVEGEVLALEWLLLQNPREPFSETRQPLPGQQHPGLGLLKQVLGMLVAVCDFLKLEGVLFSTTHFHLAYRSRRLARFVRPEHEAMMRALAVALGDRPLHETARALAEGLLVDRATGKAATWEPFPMALPVSEALRQSLCGDDYERQVARALAGLAFDLRG